MTEKPQQDQTDRDPPVPHDDELDVEGPNESAQTSQPPGESPLSDSDER